MPPRGGNGSPSLSASASACCSPTTECTRVPRPEPPRVQWGYIVVIECTLGAWRAWPCFPFLIPMRAFPPARAVALWALAMFAAAPLAAQSPLHYPIARKSDQSDTYFGTTVADPYRWLENTDAPETRQWIEAENALTFQYLSSIPERTSIKEQLTRLWNYPKYNVPTKRGKDYFFTENSGLQNQAVLYVQHGLKGERKVVLDPKTLSSDGTVALGAWDATENGRYLAYAVAAAGSDWEVIRVRDVERGVDLPDTLKWVKFSNIAWTKDHKA